MFVTTSTRNGDRIHRATCKRQGDSAPIEEAEAAQQIMEGSAKPSGCCKPKPNVEAASAPTPEPEPEPTPEPETGRATLRYTQMAKHFWRFARDGAVAVADLFDLEVIVSENARAVRLVGNERSVRLAEDIITQMWDDAPVYLADWKKQELERHKSIHVDDRWKEYYQYLRAFFSNRVADVASTI